MKRWVLVVAGAGAYAVALVATAPARLLAPRLFDATAGKVALVDARGTVWSGSGTLEARGGGSRATVSKAISWRITLATLARGALGAQVTTSDSAQPIVIVASPGRVELGQVRLSGPAGVLAVLLPKLAPLEPLGDLHLESDRVTIERGEVFGSGVLRWQPAGSGVSKIFPLGAYELRFDASAGARSATLRTLDGPLQLQGTASWSAAAARWKLNARAEVPAAHRETLSPLLRTIARDLGDGRFELAIE